jgi:hypothetical protein
MASDGFTSASPAINAGNESFSTLAESIRSNILASVIKPAETKPAQPEPMKVDTLVGQPAPPIIPAVTPQAIVSHPVLPPISSPTSTSPVVSPNSSIVKRKPGRPKKGEEIEKPPKIPKKRGRPKKSLLEEAGHSGIGSAPMAMNYVPTPISSTPPSVTADSAKKQALSSILNSTPNTMNVSNIVASYPAVNTSAAVSSSSGTSATDTWSAPAAPPTQHSTVSNVSNLLNSPTTSSTDLHSFSAPGSSKRPRGRPRKNPSPGEHVMSPKSSHDSSNGEKKKRGRPRRSDQVGHEYGLSPVISSNTLNPHNIQLSGDELDQFQIGESASSAEDDDADYESSSSDSSEVVIAFHYGCYCGTKSPSVEDQLTQRVDLLCTSCNLLFHQRCMAKQPDHSPMPGDWGYVFLCKNCNKKTNCTREHFQMYPKGWRDIVRIALYNLKFMSIIKGDSATSSFLLKDELVKMITDNWNRLCHGKAKTKRLEDLVHGTLKANPRLFVKSMRGDQEAWGLGVYDSPYLAFLTTKAKSNYEKLPSSDERVDLMSIEVQENEIDYILGVKDDGDEDSSMLLKFTDQAKPVVTINRTTAVKKFADKIVNYNKDSTTAQVTDVKSKHDVESIDLNEPEKRSINLPVSAEVLQQEQSPDDIPNLNEEVKDKEMDLS